MHPRTGLAAALAAALLTTGATSLLTPAASAEGGAGKTNPGATAQGERYSGLIIHFTDSAAASSDDGAARAAVADVARQSGHELSVVRRLSTDGVLVQVAAPLDKGQADQLINRFGARSDVAFAEVDAVMTAKLTPNDTHYTKQWHYYEAVAGMNLPPAWDLATGVGQTVAVLDTGSTVHPDLDANLVPGYDFVSN
ncbi:MAG TPA: hypothetical protein VNA12_09345, partial [Mycobacteriales bacterium]|nr:hypothetical protein [Mycobacteriales bacterium]